MVKSQKLSLISFGIKYKLRIVLYLMIVLPLLILIYFASNYIIPKEGFKADVLAVIVASMSIALCGYFLIKGIFDRIMSVSVDAKLIAAGDITHTIDVAHEDEVDELGSALNQLTQRIRTDMDELKDYSKKASEVNLGIQERILVLTHLLQVGSLISQAAPLDDIFASTVKNARFIASSNIAYILVKEENGSRFYLKIADGPNALAAQKMKIVFEGAFFGEGLRGAKPFVLDKDNRHQEDVERVFQEQCKIKSTLALPVLLRGSVSVILGIGTDRDGCVYEKVDFEMLDVFAKQLAIALENDSLLNKIEKLEIKDALTGLYNGAFITTRLDEEIKRAIIYQRPCSYIVLNIDNFRRFHDTFGTLQAESGLKKIASLIRGSVTEIDRVARIGDNEFSIVLPEKSKRQALTISEEIRKKIAFTFGEEQDYLKRLTVSGGVSENPIDGIDAATLTECAKERVERAKLQGKNRILII